MGVIIGMCGAARSGKSTVASLLGEFFQDTREVQIAGPLKQFCREVFDWTTDHTDGDLKDKPDPRYPRPCFLCRGSGGIPLIECPWLVGPCPTCAATGKTCLTPREAMQTLGDDWSTPLYEPIWALKAARDAKAIANGGATVIVTDCRFIRDIEALKAVGGIIIQVHRDESSGLLGAAAQHRGEVERNSPAFQALVDHHIYNGILDELREKVSLVAARIRPQ